MNINKLLQMRGLGHVQIGLLGPLYAERDHAPSALTVINYFAKNHPEYSRESVRVMLCALHRANLVTGFDPKAGVL